MGPEPKVGFVVTDAANRIAALRHAAYSAPGRAPKRGRRGVFVRSTQIGDQGQTSSGARTRAFSLQMRLNWGRGMKTFYTLVALGGAVWAAPAAAHIGHFGELAGHDHWIALGALGAAGAIALIAGLKGKKKDPEAEPESDEEPSEEELQEA